MSIVANFAKTQENHRSTLPTNGIVAFSAAMLAVASAFGAATAKPEPTLVDTSSSAGQVVDQSAA